MNQRLVDYIENYRCDAQSNNFIHSHFTEMTNRVKVLAGHRNYIEENKLGFGDRAFHYMWYLLLRHLIETRQRPRLLEIGVYKGQVISLWTLIGKSLGSEVHIECITPLSGNLASQNKFIEFFRVLFSKKFREDKAAGNFYTDDDYYDIIRSLFEKFQLNIRDVIFHKGLSSDYNVLQELANKEFDLVYIDGDHTRSAVEQDIKNYSTKLSRGGFLVMDDASCYLPGGENKEYWKGHLSVSQACEIIPALGFDNVLNVGHNRIYRKR
jgi:hypothetical protein